LNHTKKEIANLKKKEIEEKTHENSSLKIDLEKFVRDTTKRIQVETQLKQELEENLKALVHKQDEIEQLKSTVAKQNDNTVVTGLKEDIDKFVRDISKRTQLESELKDQLEKNSILLKQKQEEIEQLKSTVAKQNDNTVVIGLKEDIDKFVRDTMRRTELEKQLNKQIETNSVHIKDLENKLKETQGQLERSQKDNSNLKSSDEAINLRKDIEGYVRDQIRFTQRDTQLSNEIEELKKKNEQLSKETDSLEQFSTSSKQNLEKTQLEKQQLEVKLTNLEKRNSLNPNSDDSEDSRKTIESYKKQVENLQSQLEIERKRANEDTSDESSRLLDANDHHPQEETWYSFCSKFAWIPLLVIVVILLVLVYLLAAKKLQ